MLQPRAPFVFPDDTDLHDPSVLTKHLLDASAYARSTVEGIGLARLLEAAAQALQQQSAEAKVQRGLAIASQTLASELALKYEHLQQQQQHAAGAAGGAGGFFSPQAHQAQAAAAAVPMFMSGMTPLSRAAGGATPGAAPPGGLQQPQQGGSPAIGGALAMDVAPAAAPGAANGGGAAAFTSGSPGGGLDGSMNYPGAARVSKTWVSGEQAGPWDNGGVGGRPGGATINGSENLAAASGAADGGGGGGGGTPSADDADTEYQVDGMVFNLKQRFKQSGVTLPLEKANGVVYRLGTRKLQLSIRNSRLTVRVGNSYLDFLEYLSKAAL